MLVFVALAFAQEEDDGRLPGALPVTLTPVAEPIAPAPVAPPPPEVDHTKILVIEEPKPPPDRSPWLWLGVVTGGVFGAVLGAAMFAGRLIAPAPVAADEEDEPPAGPTPEA